MAPTRFEGFRSGSRATLIPNEFFTILLPAITEPAELIVSAYLFFALGRSWGSERAMTFPALASQRPLMQALSRLAPEPETALRTGLALALDRGTLLATKDRAGAETRYLVNTDGARKILATGRRTAESDPSDGDPLPGPVQPPNIFTLYEENIGSLPPLLIDELDAAGRSYPAAWIEAAFREAVANNRRSWRYIQRILERWNIEGPDYETPGRRPPLKPADGRRTIGGPYRRVIEPRGRSRP